MSKPAFNEESPQEELSSSASTQQTGQPPKRTKSVSQRGKSKQSGDEHKQEEYERDDNQHGRGERPSREGHVSGAAQAHFYLALQRGQLREVRHWLDRYPALAQVHFGDGATPLHLAARYGRQALAKLLLEAGADVLARTESATSIDATMPTQVHHVLPLWEAARAQLGEWEEIVELLLERMQAVVPNPRQLESLQAQTLGALTALDSEPFEEALTTLLAVGVTIDARDEQGATALHHAVTHRALEVIYHLAPAWR